MGVKTPEAALTFMRGIVLAGAPVRCRNRPISRKSLMMSRAASPCRPGTGPYAERVRQANMPRMSRKLPYFALNNVLHDGVF